MATRKQVALRSRKLSTQEAKGVARSLQHATLVSVGRARSMKPLSRRSTATGMGTVVFRAARVLDTFGRAGES